MSLDHRAIDAFRKAHAGVVHLACSTNCAGTPVGLDAASRKWSTARGVWLTERVGIPILQEPASLLDYADLGRSIAFGARVIARHATRARQE